MQVPFLVLLLLAKLAWALASIANSLIQRRRPNPASNHSISNQIAKNFHANMTIRANKFTPDVMLSAPRRGPGLPNSDGTKVLYRESTYSFKEHKANVEWWMLIVKTGESILIETPAEDHVSDIDWLGEGLLLFGNGDSGSTNVIIATDPRDYENTNYRAGVIDGIMESHKVTKSEDGYILAFSAKANPDGSLYNGHKAPAKHTSGKIYDVPYVRHWDYYIESQRNSIWYTTLSKPKDGSKYTIGKVNNALIKSNKKLESPIPTVSADGSVEDYDISSSGLAFVAKDPDLDPSTHTKQNLYFIPWAIGSSGDVELGEVELIDLPGFEGATSTPTFSPDGKSLAFLSMVEDGYESDKRQIFLMPDIAELTVQTLFATANSKGAWDSSPSGIIWSNKGDELYLIAEDHGRSGIFLLSIYEPVPPRLIRSEEAISSIRALKDGSLFVSGSSLVDNSIYYILSIGDSMSVNRVSSHSHAGKKFGLSSKQVSEIWYPGAQQDIHAWVVKPSNFDPSKKYPLAYLIHGGPQGAWMNSWSTRWHPAIFAEQGYVVVAPNPTGSTGYGQRLTDAIKDQWGGLPYEDLVLGFDWIGQNLKYVDNERAVALGASYGGYMMNWIQGHPLGRRFKALVTHDGVFSMTGQLASEEQYFGIHEFGGKFQKAPASWARWDPSRYTKEWKTPHLVIHSDKDYRLTVSEGLSAFNILQQNGVESRYLTFPDENHWVLKPENSLLWHAVVIDWINKFVGLPDISKEKWAKDVLLEASTKNH